MTVTVWLAVVVLRLKPNSTMMVKISPIRATVTKYKTNQTNGLKIENCNDDEDQSNQSNCTRIVTKHTLVKK